MKKFADKLSLESTDFLDLQGLVEAVILYAHDGGGIWVKVTIDPEHVVEMAKAFCEKQDEERKAWEKIRRRKSRRRAPLAPSCSRPS
jgi:hypothetical protein